MPPPVRIGYFKVPDGYEICPITQDTIRTPCVLQEYDGESMKYYNHIFEYEAIMEAVKRSPFCPICRRRVASLVVMLSPEERVVEQDVSWLRVFLVGMKTFGAYWLGALYLVSQAFLLIAFCVLLYEIVVQVPIWIWLLFLVWASYNYNSRVE